MSNDHPDSSGFWCHAASHPDQPAVIDADDHVTTYSELADRVNRLSHLLRSEGLGKGDRIAFILPNGREVVELTLACSQIGVLCLPLNHHLGADEIAYLLVDSASRAIVTHDRFASAAIEASELARLPLRVRFRAGPWRGPMPGLRSYEVDLGEHSNALPSDRSPGGTLPYTGGTTGRPKGIVRLNELQLGMQQWLDLQVANVERRGWNSGDVTLVQGPMYHSSPLGQVNYLHVGVTLVLMDKWSPEGCVERIERYRVNGGWMVATMFIRLLALPEDRRRNADVTSLKPNRISHGGGPCPIDVKQAMIDWWGPVFLGVYGATESLLTEGTSEDWLERPGTSGRPIPGVTLKIIDDEGNECPPNTIGMIYAKRDGVDHLGFEYHNAPEKTLGSRLGEFTTVGDMGYLDEEGWIFIVDRRTDLIISGGVNIYPAEVEAILVSHPQVFDVAVIGIPNDEWGKEVKAVVQPTSMELAGPDMELELIDYARSKLAAYKCPRSIDFWPELPRQTSGKLLKRSITDAYHTQSSR